MKILDLTFPAPEDNLACDDALLEAAEEGFSGEILRFWSPENCFAVLGYSNKAAAEVRLDACRKSGVPVLRRISGGGTVLQGPGCLNYSLVLRIAGRAGLANIRTTNEFVMNAHCGVFRKLAGSTVSVRGITDLALDGLKFSGNAQRRKSRYALFHGTFLLDFDIALVEKYLAMPTLEPDYRAGRKHAEFLVNLHLKPEEVKNALIDGWEASGSAEFDPADKIKKLTETFYSKESWNFKF